MSRWMRASVVLGSMLVVGYTSVVASRPAPRAAREEPRAADVFVTAISGPDELLVGTNDTVYYRIEYVNDDPFAVDQFFLTCSGAAACDEVPNGVELEPGERDTVAVAFSAGLVEEEMSVTLAAEGFLTGAMDSGARAVSVYLPMDVRVVSVPSSITQYGESYTATFEIENISGATQQYVITCDWGGGTLCTPSPSNPTMADGAIDTITATFDAGPIVSDLELSLTATALGASDTAEDTITVDVYGPVNVVPDAQTVYAAPSATDTSTFSVRVPGKSAVAFAMSCAPSNDCSVLAEDDTVMVGDTTESVRVAHNAGSNGDTTTVTLTATEVGDSAVTASGSMGVIATSEILLSVAEANPGMELDRGDCLNVSAGAVSIVCDDVQYVYPFTPVTRMNREHQTALIFNSGMARPGGVVGANFVLPPGGAEPDSIRFSLSVDGHEPGAVTYDNDVYALGEPTRIARVWHWGVAEYGTHLRNVTYTMTPFTADSAWTPVVDSAHAIDLDHRWTFGVGWWLAGHERLQVRTDSVLGDVLIWTGGDASARVYVEEATDTFVARTRSRPDTIVNQGDTAYVRSLIGGGSVHFNSSGLHQFTRDRNGNDTFFDYDGASITPVSVRAPKPSGTDTIFKLVSDSIGADLLVRAAAGGWDTYRINMTSCLGAERQINSIVAPDSTTVEFAYQDGPSCGYLLRHVIEPGERQTMLSYNTGLVRTINVSHSSETDTIRFDYEAAKAIGTNTWAGHAYKPRPVDSVSAYIDGPLPSWTDNTRFYTTGWGAVRGIRDALGNESWIEREDEDFLALPTGVRHPNGREVVSTYDGDGRVLSVTDRSTTALTRYFWNTTHEKPDSIVTAESVRTVFTYDTVGIGNIKTRKVVGSGTTTFEYDATGLVRKVTDPLGYEDMFWYDSLGNLDSLQTPDSVVTDYERDGLGRITQETRAGLTETVLVDVMGRDTLTITTNDTDSDSVWVRMEYDSIGQRTRVEPWATHPDSDSVTTGASTWEYDDFGRVVRESTPDASDSLVYDLAGRLTERHPGSGYVLRHYYDLVGRLDSVVVPADTLGAGQFDQDTHRFTYDAMGNMLTANNGFSRITRTYSLDGLVRTDEQAIAMYSDTSDFTRHVYNLEYAYDRDRRRLSISHPTWLSPDVTAYAYDVAGRLSRVIDPLGNEHNFTYDDADRRTKSAFPEGEKRMAYDPLGRLVADSILVDGTVELRTTLARNARGLVESIGGDQLGSNEYNGLGHLVSSSGLAWQGPETGEAFVTDGFGTRLRRATLQNVGPKTDSTVFNSMMQINSGGRLLSQTEEYVRELPSTEPSDWEPGRNSYAYDNRGNRVSSTQTRYLWDIEEVEPPQGADSIVTYIENTWSHYSPDNKLRIHIVERDSTDHDSPPQSNTEWGVYEEYWYDALGRRILKVSIQDDTLEYPCEITARCHSSIERFVWDGDQILWELRQDGQGDVKNPSGGPQSGAIGWVHGPGIDAPLGMVGKEGGVMLHRNWRGLYAFGTDSDGDFTTCTPAGGVACTQVKWPGGSYSAYLESHDPEYQTWYGSLVADQRDATGLSYRRNRFYDPESGQFTQEDPIGIAGGLNLYGYAGGDPINFSDPFGLCPWCIFEVAASVVDAVDLGVTGIRYLAGSASGEELGVTVAGAFAGVVGVGGGGGRVARRALKNSRDAAAEALPTISRGRLHGDLPSLESLGDLRRADLEDFAADLRTSIADRTQTGRQLGLDSGHGRRLNEELELLRRTERLLTEGR